MEEKFVSKNQFDLSNFVIISVIILMLLVLVAVGLPSLFSTKHPGKRSKIRIMLLNLSVALKKYEIDCGGLPPHTPGLFDSKTLVIYLDGDSSNGGPEKAYFEFKPEEISLVTGDYLDPYGRTYHYRQPKNPDGTQNLEIINKNLFDLWSDGENSVAEGDIKGEDDIANWAQD